VRPHPDDDASEGAVSIVGLLLFLLALRLAASTRWRMMRKEQAARKPNNVLANPTPGTGKPRIECSCQQRPEYRAPLQPPVEPFVAPLARDDTTAVAIVSPMTAASCCDGGALMAGRALVAAR